MHVACFSVSEFEIKLTKVFNDPVLSSLIIDLYEKYLFCLGVCPGEIEDYFADHEDMHDFKLRYDMWGMPLSQNSMFNDSIFEKVLKRSLSFSDEMCLKFVMCEGEYFIESGLVVVTPQNEGHV